MLAGQALLRANDGGTELTIGTPPTCFRPGDWAPTIDPCHVEIALVSIAGGLGRKQGFEGFQFSGYRRGRLFLNTQV
jgi:hypothetical protein